jgi:hypothetical protein
MKYSKIIFFIATIFLFLSCQKEELKPDNTIVVDNTIYEFTDIDWVLTDGRFYMENLDNGEKTFYDHFGATQQLSVLNPITGAALPFDTIVQGLTTWRFSANNFILNSTNFYGFTHIDNTVTAVGMENGSSRPMTVIEIDEVSVTFKVHEGYASFDGYNYYFYSTLTFVKAGEACNGCQPDAYFGYTYQGVIPNSNDNTNNLVGTKWVVTKYYDGFSNNYPNDTLDFFNNTQYRINNGTSINYTLSSVFGNNMSELTLYGFYTIGGDFSGMVPNSFVTNGEINSALFTDIFNTNNDKLVWMVRIQ